MSWKDVVDRVSAATGLPKAQVARTLTATLAEVERELVASGSVGLPGIGTLGRHWSAERTVRSVADGRKVAVDGRWRATFRPAAGLRAALRELTPQLLKDPAHQRAWRLAETLVGDLALYHAARAPQDLAPDADPVTVEARCGQAFGPAWGRARQTFDEQVPAPVRAARDHLAHAARRRWAPPTQA